MNVGWYRGKTVIIDAHAHFVPPALLDELTSGRRPFPSVKVAADGGVRLSFAGNEAKRPVPAGMSTAEARRQWLAAHGIDRQVVGGWLDMFGYELPADEAADWSRFLNTHMLAATAQAAVPGAARDRADAVRAARRPRSWRRRSTPASTAP